MKKCPVCSLVNPDTAISCDCGFNFELKKVDDQTYKIWHSIFLQQFRNIIYGLFLILFGLIIIILSYDKKPWGYSFLMPGCVGIGIIFLIKGIRDFLKFYNRLKRSKTIDPR